RWGDPRFGQPAEAEQVDEVVGVPLVVFTRRRPRLFPNGCARSTRAPSSSRSCHRLGQGRRAVIGADLRQHFTSRVLPHDHRTAPGPSRPGEAPDSVTRLAIPASVTPAITYSPNPPVTPPAATSGFITITSACCSLAILWS